MQKIKKHLTMKELPVTERPYESVRKTEQGRFPMRSFLLLYSRQEPEGTR